MFGGLILQTLFLLLNCIPSISSIPCYVCESTFPSSNICLPPCAQSDQLNSTCQLTRNIPLDVSSLGSVSADHINDDPFLSSAVESNFVFGEEAAYLNPSQAVGWDWEYGPITYGCDTPGCNDPRNVNRLPSALNARIPNGTLNQYLVGELDNNCYRCDTCLDESAPNLNMSTCVSESCPNQACNFIVTRSSATTIGQCGSAWHFFSACNPSREYAQVDMTLMYYIRSQTMVLYQMASVCLSDNCNNFTTFIQLKNAITVDPDLSCLINGTSTTTTTIITTSSSAASSASTTSISSTTSASTTSIGSTISASTTSTTTAESSAHPMSMNNPLFILMIFYFLHKRQ